MSRCILTTPLCLLLASSFLSAQPSASGAARVEPEVLSAFEANAAGRVYVLVALREPLLPSGAGWEARRAAIRAQGDAALAGISSLDFAPAYRYRHFAGLTGRATRAGVARLAASPVVTAVDTDKVGHALGQRSAAGFLGVTQARETFGVTGRGYGVVVLDTGVDSDHPDLVDDILPGGWTFLDQGATSHAGGEDDWFHGTAVAGVITSRGTVAPVGIAPDAKILSIKVITNTNSVTASDAIAGFDYTLSLKLSGDARYEGLIAINCSFGLGTSTLCPCDDFLFERAVRTAKEAGIMTFAASGNLGRCGSIGTPACLSSSVAVGAIYHEDVGGQGFGFGDGCTDPTTRPDQISCFTNLNDCVDLLAPFNVDSTAIGGGVELFGGTSAATPHAAAAALLVQEAAGGALLPDEVVGILKETGVQVDDRCGVFGSFPRIDALSAVTAAASAGSDCDASGVSDLVEILRGESPDCNQNRVPDACDLAAGTSRDCDGNAVPDECDADCNRNGVPDACDIALGAAPDCNANGIPDGCDVVPSAQEFSPGPSAEVGAGAAGTVLADLDQDGLADLAVVVSSTATVRIHRNDGSGAQVFRAEQDAGGEGPLAVVTADIDADGNLDLVVLHAGSAFTPGESLAVLRGQGSGAFEDAVVFPTGSFPFDVVAADFDGDGLPDLVTANARSEDLTVLRNQTQTGGPIAFAPLASYPLLVTPSSVVVIDVDRDGRLDLVSGGPAASGLDVFLGNGDGTFQPPEHTLHDLSPRFLVAGDLDGDGFPDIAALDAFSAPPGGGVRLLVSRPGGFTSPVALELEEFPLVTPASELALADLSGDGFADIVALLPGIVTVSYLRSTGAGRYDPPRLLNQASGPSGLATGDIDGDGDLDLGVISSGAFVILRNDLTPPASADRDEDGIPDECAPPPVRFRRGNANADAEADISDAVTVLGFLFLGRPESFACDKAADTNDDGGIDLSDAVALLNHLFLGGQAPPPPFGECGVDPTEDGLTCGEPGPCA